MLSYKRVAKDFIKPGRALKLSEAYGSDTNMPQFAIMAENGQQIGSWMRCKDYIQDVVWGSKQGVAYSVHGWQYDPAVDSRISEKWLILAIKWPSKSDAQLERALENAKHTLENLEKMLSVPKFQRSRFSRRIGDHFIIYGGQHWLKSAGTVSLLTWLLRASLTNSHQTFESLMMMKKFAVANDGYYSKRGKFYIDHLIKVGFEGIPSDWTTFSAAYQVHGNGFVGQSYQMATKLGAKIDYGHDAAMGVADDDWF